MCFWYVSLGSKVIPRNLKDLVYLSSSPLSHSLGKLSFSLFMWKLRHQVFSALSLIRHLEQKDSRSVRIFLEMCWYKSFPSFVCINWCSVWCIICIKGGHHFFWEYWGHFSVGVFMCKMWRLNLIIIIYWISSFLV